MKFFLLFNQLLYFPVSIALGTCFGRGEWKGIVGAAGQVALKTYAVKKLLFLVLAFFFSSTLIFALAHLADPWRSFGFIIPPPRPVAEVIERITREYGLDQPLPVQYLIWMRKLLGGDLGYSFAASRSVWGLVSLGVLPTVGLVVSAGIVSVVIATFSGVVAAVKEHSTIDSLASCLALVGRSAPSFWIALMALMISWWLHWITDGRMSVSLFVLPPFVLRFVLPTFLLALGWAPYFFRIVRSGILEVMQKDYIVDAKATSLRERVGIYKHALSDALLPMVKYLGHSVGFMLGSTVVIDWMFSCGGLGKLLVAYAGIRDYFAVLGISMTIVAMALVINFCADITHEALKPSNERLPSRGVPT